jgi:hypothetical protein
MARNRDTRRPRHFSRPRRNQARASRGDLRGSAEAERDGDALGLGGPLADGKFGGTGFVVEGVGGGGVVVCV